MVESTQNTSELNQEQQINTVIAEQKTANDEEVKTIEQASTDADNDKQYVVLEQEEWDQEKYQQMDDMELDVEGIDLISNEVQNYEPQDEQIFLTTSKGQQQRLIFNVPIVLMQAEEEHLVNFRKFLQENSHTIPDGYDDDGRLILRYLQASRFNYNKAYGMVLEHKEWRVQNFPCKPVSYMKYLTKNMVYICKRDKYQHPIIVINCQAILKEDPDPEEMTMFAVFFLDFVVSKLMVPSRVENIMIICDLANIGVTNLPVSKIKGFLSIAQKNFRARMFRCFVINSTWMIRATWRLCTSVLDEFTAQKMVVLSSDYQEELLKMIDQDCLEEKYGGTIPDLEGVCFPPNMSIPHVQRDQVPLKWKKMETQEQEVEADKKQENCISEQNNQSDANNEVAESVENS